MDRIRDAAAPTLEPWQTVEVLSMHAHCWAPHRCHLASISVNGYADDLGPPTDSGSSSAVLPSLTPLVWSTVECAVRTAADGAAAAMPRVAPEACCPCCCSHGRRHLRLMLPLPLTRRLGVLSARQGGDPRGSTPPEDPRRHTLLRQLRRSRGGSRAAGVMQPTDGGRDAETARIWMGAPMLPRCAGAVRSEQSWALQSACAVNRSGCTGKCSRNGVIENGSVWR